MVGELQASRSHWVTVTAVVAGLLPGFIWLGAYYFLADAFPVVSDLGSWNFAIGAGLLIVGATIALILLSGSEETPSAIQGYNPQTNSLAIAALVLGFVLPLAAIPVGHVARAQMRRSGEQGAGLALVGLVLGYLPLASVVIALTVVLVVVDQQS
ncbi:cell division protein CrgA [Nocardia sp. NPDC050378]|uniref:cell division protein CrgA n=1 Tax=Nocardia sp. NPDC050378 TaxID=3155400 RepID=UPI00340F001E